MKKLLFVYAIIISSNFSFSQTKEYTFSNVGVELNGIEAPIQKNAGVIVISDSEIITRGSKDTKYEIIHRSEKNDQITYIVRPLNGSYSCKIYHLVQEKIIKIDATKDGINAISIYYLDN